jgi:hypothetical protein
MRRMRRALLLLAGLAALYLVVLPLVRPEPTVSVSLPEAAQPSRPLPVEVHLRAWSADARVVNVRVLQADGDTLPLTLYTTVQQVTIPWRQAAVTLPHTSTLALEVPAAAVGALAGGDGVVDGVVEVEVEQADPLPDRFGLALGRSAERRVEREPFTLPLAP